MTQSPQDPLRLSHPIILIAGYGAFSRVGPIEYFYGLPSRLRRAGNSVYVPELPVLQTIEKRAEILMGQLNEKYPDGKVNLVGHSMGGLVARWLAAQPDFKDRVASVTTIGTPNRGSRLGQLAHQFLPSPAVSLVDKLLGIFDTNSQGLMQLRPEHMNDEFLKAAPDQPGVAYFSATTAIPDPVKTHSLPLFWPTHKLLLEAEGENDGFVSVHSATWGEHICTEKGDHYAQIGQILGHTRGLDYVAFQDRIFSTLRHRLF
jgi:triacylglycerol lipase